MNGEGSGGGTGLMDDGRVSVLITLVSADCASWDGLTAPGAPMSMNRMVSVPIKMRQKPNLFVWQTGCNVSSSSFGWFTRKELSSSPSSLVDTR